MKKQVMFLATMCAVMGVNAQGLERGKEYVDLGLPSKTLWAKHNVGATSPTDFGYYYAWGELEGTDNSTPAKKSFSWLAYKDDNDNNVGKSFDKYNELGKSLEATDDVATQEWGGEWRMPTVKEFNELLDNCQKEWTQENGVNGYKFTSTINNASIFLPAAGYRYISSLTEDNNLGNYWSRELSQEADHVGYGMQLNFDGSKVYVKENYRYLGLTIRPVCKKDNTPVVTVCDVEKCIVEGSLVVNNVSDYVPQYRTWALDRALVSVNDGDQSTAIQGNNASIKSNTSSSLEVKVGDKIKVAGVCQRNAVFALVAFSSNGGDFDIVEKVNLDSEKRFSVEFTVPEGAVVGQTTLRVIVDGDLANFYNGSPRNVSTLKPEYTACGFTGSLGNKNVENAVGFAASVNNVRLKIVEENEEEDATSLAPITETGVKVAVCGETLKVEGATAGDVLRVLDCAGVEVYRATVNSSVVNVNLQNRGVYVVCLQGSCNAAFKVVR